MFFLSLEIGVCEDSLTSWSPVLHNCNGMWRDSMQKKRILIWMTVRCIVILVLTAKRPTWSSQPILNQLFFLLTSCVTHLVEHWPTEWIFHHHQTKNLKHFPYHMVFRCRSSFYDCGQYLSKFPTSPLFGVLSFSEEAQLWMLKAYSMHQSTTKAHHHRLILNLPDLELNVLFQTE